MEFYIQRLYLIFLLTGQAFILTMLISTHGEETNFKTVDLNQLPPDEPPTSPFCSLTPDEHPLSFQLRSLPPTPPLDASVEDALIQRYLGLHSASSAPKSFLTNHRPTGPYKRKSLDTNVEQPKSNLIDSEQKRKKSLLRYQQTWPAENESASSGDTADAIRLRQLEKQPIESFKNAPTDQYEKGLQLEESERKIVLFNVKYWSFLIHKSNTEIAKDQQNTSEQFVPESLFEFLNELKTEIIVKKGGKRPANPPGNPDKHLWISKEHATDFLKTYRGRRDMMPYPLTFTSPERCLQTYNMILMLADEKLRLEDYPVFSEGIVAWINLKLTRKLANIPGKVTKRKKQITARVGIVEKLTKCITFFNIIYLSLLNEHQNGQLTRGYVDDFLSFLRTLWHNIERGEEDQLFRETTFAWKLHDMLNFGKYWGPTKSSTNAMGIAWDVLQYWANQKGIFFPKSPNNLSELVNKIIVYSNYRTINDKIRLINWQLHYTN
ncbi:uncharacterized protein PGTG_15484 [Puccinia graminis f. sp. tritici CRL 75-36-700-3]|uniref:Uncharacterized protein n=1 Tax=Puccinia graminis f. sp. tritici (strain CRL 75-36-700-3 / race SCCL) TaxID=418459 RepID=E3KYB4_PUCGT|nr:uncharacterized protein PGTG_15484 [Puccinia graminis f. sp. tritici CRL 75-36-700-3]EFP89305.2 hypothetical protein PGTG_15484 [Puccinia graminis f. sp. tritici CRL 75-36-700-3]